MEQWSIGVMEYWSDGVLGVMEVMEYWRRVKSCRIDRGSRG